MINQNDLKLFEISCKETLMNIVKESKVLDEKLSFFQKVLLYDKIKEMSVHEVTSLLFEFESKTARNVKYGAAGVAGFKAGRYFGKRGMIGAAAGAGLLFLFRKVADPCVRNHIGNPRAQLECKAAAARKVVEQIQTNMQSCYNAEDPMGCRNKLHRDLQVWQNKLATYSNQLEKYK